VLAALVVVAEKGSPSDYPFLVNTAEVSSIKQCLFRPFSGQLRLSTLFSTSEPPRLTLSTMLFINAIFALYFAAVALAAPQAVPDLSMSC
jgi:hypothetical protein